MKTIEYSRQAEKFILSQTKKQAQRIKDSIEKIPLGDIRRLEGTGSLILYRLRIGNYRALYFYASENIKIVKIDTRGDVYKR